MSFSLHSAVVPGFRQILGSVGQLLAKAQDHCREHGLPPEELIQARLADDMFPFAFQVKSTAVHSAGAIEGLRRGVFSPDRSEPPDSFTGLAERVRQADSELAALDPAELDGMIGRAMRFEMGEFRMDFTAENFLLSFSQPNFYFHASTAYAILRMKGLPIGKRDFLGKLALRPAGE